MFCHNCGEKLPEDAKYCIKCGISTLKTTVTKTEPTLVKSTLDGQIEGLQPIAADSLNAPGDLEKTFSSEEANAIIETHSGGYKKSGRLWFWGFGLLFFAMSLVYLYRMLMLGVNPVDFSRFSLLIFIGLLFTPLSWDVIVRRAKLKNRQSNVIRFCAIIGLIAVDSAFIPKGENLIESEAALTNSQSATYSSNDLPSDKIDQNIEAYLGRTPDEVARSFTNCKPVSNYPTYKDQVTWQYLIKADVGGEDWVTSYCTVFDAKIDGLYTTGWVSPDGWFYQNKLIGLEIREEMPDSVAEIIENEELTGNFDSAFKMAAKIGIGKDGKRYLDHDLNRGIMIYEGNDLMGAVWDDDLRLFCSEKTRVMKYIILKNTSINYGIWDCQKFYEVVKHHNKLNSENGNSALKKAFD
jgi:hypothetical protein